MINLNKIFEVIAPTVENIGYEFVHMEMTRQSIDKVLRIYIDAPGGIGTKDCVTVSKQISAVLDVEDLIRSRYLLEVSSPGLNRPLVKPGHFRQFIGSPAKIVMNRQLHGKRSYKGEITEANDQAVVIQVDGESLRLQYKDMKSARLDSIV